MRLHTLGQVAASATKRSLAVPVLLLYVFWYLYLVALLRWFHG